MAKTKQRKMRPITIDEALKMAVLGGLRISPDGESVAFVKSEVRQDEKTRGTTVWAASADGSNVDQLTQGPEDGQPCWSPDGQTLAFTRKADKEKPAQIFLLPLRGGEPSRLTELQTEQEALKFTPDGRRLGFLAPTPDDKRRKRRKEKGDDAQVFVKDEKPKRLWTASVKSGKARAVSPEELTVWEYDWFPDGRSAAVIYADDPRLDTRMFRARLGILDTGDATIALIEAGLSFMSQPRVSPDGTHVALVASMSEAPFGGEAWIVDLGSGKATCLTPDLPATVDLVEWLPDGSGLVLLVAEGMLSLVYRVSLESPGDLQRVCADLPSSIDELAAAEDGEAVFVVAQDFEETPELWRGETVSGDVTKLTKENRPADRLRLGQSRVIRWPSTDDLEIEGIVTLPPGFKRTKTYPTILLVHGGPCSRFRQDLGLLPRQLLANEGYVVLLPNPRGSTGYGRGFSTANFGDWGGGDFGDLMAGVDVLVEGGIADPERLGIHGGSYGGFMTAWTVTQTDRFKAAVCQCGLSNLFSFHGQTDITPGFLELYFGESPYDDPDRYRDRSAMTHIKNAKTPTLFLHGEKDVRVPIAQSYEMYWGLVHMGVETEFVIYPREGHGILETPHQRDVYTRVVAWFDRHLK